MKKYVESLLILSVLFFAFMPVYGQNAQNSTYYNNLVADMIRQFKIMQDENAKLNASAEDLRRRVRSTEEYVRRLSAENETLKKQLAAEREARATQIANLERLVREIGKAAAAPAPAPREKTPSPSAAPASSSSSESGEFYEHTVEAGQNLTAIAKAYKVSVNDIRQANHLKNSNLRVGQKLLIPVKDAPASAEKAKTSGKGKSSRKKQ